MLCCTWFLIASLFVRVRAWGPLTHVDFCHDSLSSSVTATSRRAAREAGCMVPDALKRQWPALHSLEFASYLFQEAQNNELLLEFAVGYAFHVGHDLLGHHVPGGFLSPPSADHVTEFAVDSYLYHAQDVKFLDTTITQSQAELVANASKFILGQSLKPHQVLQAVHAFRDLISVEQVALYTSGRHVYKHTLVQHVQHDICQGNNASGEFSQVVDILNFTKTVWIRNISNRIRSEISRGNTSRTRLNTTIDSFVDTLISNHGDSSCVPLELTISQQTRSNQNDNKATLWKPPTQQMTLTNDRPLAQRKLQHQKIDLSN
eukprot:scaffold60054_cov47-Attheya_sp.AAC.1